MLRFPYLEEPLLGPAPPSLSPNAVSRWRPLDPVRLRELTGISRLFLQALVDPGADDTALPRDAARLVGIRFRPTTRNAIRWRGQSYPLEFGDAKIELADDQSMW